MIDIEHGNSVLIFKLRSWFAILLVVILLFLLPAITQFRNPPPSNFILTWWLHFAVSLVSVVANLVALSGHHRARGWIRVVHYLGFSIGVLIAVTLYFEVYGYTFFQE
jgi:hypothetical protein